MVVIIIKSDETKYSTAMPNPPKTSQMIFPSIFIIFSMLNVYARTQVKVAGERGIWSRPTVCDL